MTTADSRMLDCPKVRKAIGAVADKYGFDLNVDGSLELHQEPWMPFTISKSASELTFGYHRIENGDLVPDPWVQLRLEVDWTPVCIDQGWFGCSLARDGYPISDIRDFAEDYAEIIVARYVSGTADRVIRLLDQTPRRPG